ncbi:carboxypeptidase-like regulatory domain-containing protein [Xanthocytophaga agilis]|uniref:Carboxypeptidase-like regulatory domain-containing protein n=1 Tax=Xanthocytophaga agilis TaxID=3048010 RepID=A0AAE3QW85_9BACT|nr:carboxypeptidase-like regulatory domain-containing protein [Xanthocytophaga agilis]MDJ1499196.1 carboxypeptidase-like regulatory domain-containing protein [Xanthocytophaga agilis]
MKHFLFTLFFLTSLIPAFTQAQDRVISGRLKDANGEPLPGVSISVKGTTQGTTTNAEGYYRITAPLGATLVISFIGFTTREVQVTEKNSTALGSGDSSESEPVQIPSSQMVQNEAQQSTQPPTQPTPEKTGVATLTDDSPRYTIQSYTTFPNQNPLTNTYTLRYVKGWLARLQYGSKARNGIFVADTRPYIQAPVQLIFSSSFTLDQINQLPDLQSQYAQGRPVNGIETWQGSETGEIFSWGPKINNLEFDGQPYAYDPNGALTTRGNGNGNRAKAYNPYQFFRNGMTTNHTLTLKTTLWKTDLKTGFTYHTQQGVVPNAHTNESQWNLNLKRLIMPALRAEFSLFYTSINQTLPNQNGNWAHILSSVMQTAPTFDNAGGLSRREALRNEDAYLLSDNQFRTYSAGNTDNPYALVNLLPDNQNIRNLFTNLSLNYDQNNFQVLLKGSLEHKNQNRVFGIVPAMTTYPEGRLTTREYKLSNYQFTAKPSFDTYLNSSSTIYLETSVSYTFAHQQEQLNRKDGFRFASTESFDIRNADSLAIRKFTPLRQKHEIAESIRLKYRDLVLLNLTNQHYFSSTYTKGKFWLPTIGLGFTFSELFSYSSFLNFAKVYANYSQNIQEAPLIYNQWQYNSTQYAASNFAPYQETQEIVYTRQLQPEKTTKKELGLDMNIIQNRLHVSASYFQNLTQQALVPIFSENGFLLQNLADIENKGYEWSVSYQHHTGAVRFMSRVSFSKVKPVVTKLYNNGTRIPIAGFSDVSTNLVAGQPYGVLMGSRWKTNENGQTIIGTDGYPVVDDQPQIIGNPNPRWTASTEHTIWWKGWSCNILFDFRQGGDIWNGTQASLNYLGVSKVTEQQRPTQNYIFEGVQENGKPNGIMVDFANSAHGLQDNRWVRYGQSGVGAESIQKSSWIRLQEVKLSYKFPSYRQHFLPRCDIQVSVSGRNLWLSTPYKGVDPAGTLFGYNTATGLDLFNAPSLRSYGASVQITI